MPSYESWNWFRAAGRTAWLCPYNSNICLPLSWSYSILLGSDRLLFLLFPVKHKEKRNNVAMNLQSPQISDGQTSTAKWCVMTPGQRLAWWLKAPSTFCHEWKERLTLVLALYSEGSGTLSEQTWGGGKKNQSHVIKVKNNNKKKHIHTPNPHRPAASWQSPSLARVNVSWTWARK